MSPARIAVASSSGKSPVLRASWSKILFITHRLALEDAYFALRGRMRRRWHGPESFGSFRPWRGAGRRRGRQGHHPSWDRALRSCNVGSVTLRLDPRMDDDL